MEAKDTEWLSDPVQWWKNPAVWEGEPWKGDW